MVILNAQLCIRCVLGLVLLESLQGWRQWTSGPGSVRLVFRMHYDCRTHSNCIRPKLYLLSGVFQFLKFVKNWKFQARMTLIRRTIESGSSTFPKQSKVWVCFPFLAWKTPGPYRMLSSTKLRGWGPGHLQHRKSCMDCPRKNSSFQEKFTAQTFQTAALGVLRCRMGLWPPWGSPLIETWPPPPQSWKMGRLHPSNQGQGKG